MLKRPTIPEQNLSLCRSAHMVLKWDCQRANCEAGFVPPCGLSGIFFLPTRHARTQGLTGQRKQGDSHNKAAQREICQQLKGVCATSKHYLPMFQSKASTLSDTHKQTHTPKPPHTIDQEHSCVHKRLTLWEWKSGPACFSFSTAQPVSLEQFSLCVEVGRL